MKRGPGRPSGTYSQAARVLLLERAIWRREEVTVADLAEEFRVSPRSIRRDLHVLVRARRGIELAKGTVSVSPMALAQAPGVGAAVARIRYAARAAGGGAGEVLHALADELATGRLLDLGAEPTGAVR